MPRKVKKQEAIDIIKSVDAIDIQYQIIFRSAPDSKKRELHRAINAVVDSYIRDERDIVILAIKVK